MTLSKASPVAPGLHAQVDDRVHTWWLSNEARRNAVHPEALRWMTEQAVTLDGQLVVLRGAGDRAFCAGFDLTALRLGHGNAADTMPDESLIAATSALRRARATLVAVLQGHVIGAGVELACACDLRVASTTTTFAVPAAELGVVYHADGLANIHRVFGPAGVRRLLMLGDRLTAEQALGMGALVRLVEQDALEAALSEVLDRLQRAAPLSLQGNRDLLRQLDRGPLDDATRAEHDRRRVQAYASEDHREARQARIERRPPRFRGR